MTLPRLIFLALSFFYVSATHFHLPHLPLPQCEVISHYGTIPGDVEGELGDRTINDYKLSVRYSPLEGKLVVIKKKADLKFLVVLVAKERCEAKYLLDNVNVETDASGNTLITYDQKPNHRLRVTVRPDMVVCTEHV